jgi:putative tricarboxylic transport membrane protein
VSARGRSLTGARPYWLGLGIAAIGAVWIYGALSLSQTAQYAKIGPGLFLMVIGIVLIALGGLLILQIARGEVFSPQETEDAEADAPTNWPAFAYAAAAAALPIFTMKPLGFPITGALSFTLIARAFGSRRSTLDLGIGIVLAVVSYLLFVQLGVTLGGPLPLLTGR